MSTWPLRPSTAVRSPTASSSSTSPTTGDPRNSRRATSRTRSTAVVTTPPAPASPTASAPRSSARRLSPTAAPKSRCAAGFHTHPHCCSLTSYMTAPLELKHEHDKQPRPVLGAVGWEQQQWRHTVPAPTICIVTTMPTSHIKK
jgi:hypothetical protein